MTYKFYDLTPEELLALIESQANKITSALTALRNRGV